jgi:diguanylate cyclase (GGDEF)-like protein
MTLFGLDSIAPMIGGAVLTGAFSFFGGLWLGRKSVDGSERSLETRFIPNDDSEIRSRFQPQSDPVLETQSVELLFHEADVCTSLTSFLKWIVPDSSLGFAAIVGTGSKTVFQTVAEGLSKLSIGHLAVPDKLLSRLKCESPLVLDSEIDKSSILRWLDEVDREKVRKLCLTALDDGSGLVAVLITSSTWPAGLLEIEQRAIVKLAAKAVGNRWHQMLTLERQSQELQSTRDMLELRGIIDSQLDDPFEALNQFASRLCDIVSADRIAIYFVARRSGEQLQPIVQCGYRMPSGTEAAWQLHEQALAKIAIESEAGRLHDGEWLQNLRTNSPIAASVSMPIRINGRILGALCLTCQDQNGALDGNRRIIEFAAEILSQTLRRVFDEATIRRQANHDHLTDLVNRRSLDAYLAAEVERIKNGDSPTCSLILSDLDRFKSINDRFGHQAGDHVLRETARILSEQVSRLRMGEHSIVARYGGEEFAILLPNVGHLGAARIAESIRAAVESETIRIQETTLTVTLSLGVAACPDQATTVVSLIAAADKALYQAKSNGRNCVVHA